ncbi:hypothetical protein FPV67DRAFT_782995 [Lyophyllum atratum]|nr:hypothetical protein FPV67DRAFT_782995 [Lyophyllum atratum]
MAKTSLKLSKIQLREAGCHTLGFSWFDSSARPRPNTQVPDSSSSASLKLWCHRIRRFRKIGLVETTGRVCIQVPVPPLDHTQLSWTARPKHGGALLSLFQDRSEARIQWLSLFTTSSTPRYPDPGPPHPPPHTLAHPVMLATPIPRNGSALQSSFRSSLVGHFLHSLESDLRPSPYQQAPRAQPEDTTPNPMFANLVMAVTFLAPAIVGMTVIAPQSMRIMAERLCRLTSESAYLDELSMYLGRNRQFHIPRGTSDTWRTIINYHANGPSSTFLHEF